MPRLTKAALQKHLQQLEKEDLVAELVKLFTRFKPVNEYFQMEFGENTQAVTEHYKAQIRKAFFGGRSRRPKLATTRKIISEFRKVALFEYDMVDLLLYRVECSIEFINQYYYPEEPFYKSIQNAFAEALQMIVGNNLTGEFKDRCEKIVWFAGEKTSFGLHATLWEAYKATFETSSPTPLLPGGRKTPESESSSPSERDLG